MKKKKKNNEYFILVGPNKNSKNYLLTKHSYIKSFLLQFCSSHVHFPVKIRSSKSLNIT